MPWRGLSGSWLRDINGGIREQEETKNRRQRQEQGEDQSVGSIVIVYNGSIRCYTRLERDTAQ